MTDLERELLDRLVAVSVQLAEKQDYINRSEHAYHDSEEENFRLRKELEDVRYQAKELCKIIDDLKLQNATLRSLTTSAEKPIEFTDE